MLQIKLKFQNMIKLKLSMFFIITCCLFLIGCAQDFGSSISLDGEWNVKLDSLNKGISEKWQNNDLEGRTISLPGTLDDAGIGKPSSLEPALNNYVLSHLNRKHEYYGKAWYQREVDIPKNWSNKQISLKLERVLWESKVYIDGQLAGARESLIGSHDYDLTEMLSPGKHRLTIMIDNSNKYPFINVIGDRYPVPADKEMAHAYTNHTQIKWNGILGDMTLNATSKNASENLQIYPDLENNAINVVFQQANAQGKKLTVEVLNTEGEMVISEEIKNPLIEGNYINFSINRPEELQYWDEFNPKVYLARIISQNDTITTNFGYRKISHEDGILKLNGNRIFLRGNLECVIFPLTGYPPMEREGWEKLFGQAKNYG